MAKITLTPREGSRQHFREIFPGENNQVYSIESLGDMIETPK